MITKIAIKSTVAFLTILLLAGCASSRRPIETLPRPKEPLIADKKIDSRTLIVIDAGHGGDDHGTRSSSQPTYEEKTLTLNTAKMVEKHLNNLGYRTVMTRNSDTFIPLTGRAKIANDERAALFVSVHYNSAPSPDAHGIEVFYYKTESDKSRSQLSKLCAEAVLENVITKTKARSRGVKHGNFAVIRETKMPAILIEGGFMTNREEMQKIKSPGYMEGLAHAIALGVNKYLNPHQND